MATFVCKRRLMNDLKTLQKEPLPLIDIYPDQSDILTWYFLIKGPEDSDYKGGYYLGKIIYGPNYPFQPPDFVILTPNGRFTINHKICLTNSGYHKGEWNSLWTTPAIILGLLSVMLDDVDNGIGHIHCTPQERNSFAKNSIEYNKQHHKQLLTSFTRFCDNDGNVKS